MTGTYDKIRLYDVEENPFLKHAKNLVPRKVVYGDNFALCLIEKHNPNKYYCFFTNHGFYDKMAYYPRNVIKKISLEDYFKISYRLKRLGYKLNLKKIIYDSNRNK